MKLLCLKLFPLILWGFLLGGCGQLPDYRKYDDVDLEPPMLLKLFPSDENTLKAVFSESPASLEGVTLLPDLSALDPVLSGNEALLPCGRPMEPGVKYILEATVKDAAGNSMAFLYPFFGYNPDPPALLINEVTTQGSTSHPDRVEIKILEDGNMAGICFLEGTDGNWASRLVFPAFRAAAGDFLVIHCKPQGIPEEIDETEGCAVSGGIDAHPGARDFWLPRGDGLGGNNGVLTVCAYPGGPVLDGFLYSNRTSSSDTNYRGFGSRTVMEMADELKMAGEWLCPGEMITPEDAVNPDPSTATRSICRMPVGEDQNEAADWHVVPTGMASFGEINSAEIYTP